jgi:hypothetical protein
MHIWNEPSPEMQRTGSPGEPIAAPIAAGNP